MAARPDVPGDTSTLEVLAIGEAVSSTIDFPGDEGWYAVDVAADTQYVFDLSGDFDAAAPLFDPIVRLYDETGALLDEQDGFDRTTLGFRPTFDGTVFASAGGAFDDTGDYVLTVDAIEDVPGDVSTSETIAVDGAGRPGALAFAGDEDGFRVELDAGGTYRFHLVSNPPAAESLEDSLFLLYDAQGVLSDEDDDSDEDLNAQLLHTMEVDEVVCAFASGFGDSVGDYELSVNIDTFVAQDPGRSISN